MWGEHYHYIISILQMRRLQQKLGKRPQRWKPLSTLPGMGTGGTLRCLLRRHTSAWALMVCLLARKCMTSWYHSYHLWISLGACLWRWWGAHCRRLTSSLHGVGTGRGIPATSQSTWIWFVSTRRWAAHTLTQMIQGPCEDPPVISCRSCAGLAVHQCSSVLLSPKQNVVL